MEIGTQALRISAINFKGFFLSYLQSNIRRQLKMGLFRRSKSKLSNARWSKPKARPGEKVALRVMEDYKGKYKSVVTKEWEEKSAGNNFTAAEKDQFIETVSEEYTNEIFEQKSVQLEDPTREVREIIKAAVMREVTKFVDSEIANQRKLKR